MQDWQPTNPVELRLMDAHTDWLSFAKDRGARLMIWRTNEADAQLVQLYFQAQQELSCAVLRLRSGFYDEARYGDALTDEIGRFYESRREASHAQGIEADWQRPPRGKSGSIAYLFAVANSLIRHHPDIFPAIVLVLEPVQCADEAALTHWLGELLTTMGRAPQFGEKLRFVMPRIEVESLLPLLAAHPRTARMIEGRYSMKSVPRELLAESGERGASGEFRRLFIELGETVGSGDAATLERLRTAALAIAERENWFDQCVVVHLIAGAAYLKWREHARSIEAYQCAVKSGERAVAAGHPAGHKLVANGLFGEASAHLTQKSFAPAAYCYERAAASTGAAKDALMTVEAWRMSAVCWEKSGEREHALEAGFSALDAGLALDESMRASSTLPLVVKWMASQVGAFDRRREELSQKVAALSVAR